MSNHSTISMQILAAIASVAEKPLSSIVPNTQLIGDGSILDSMKLVELCLQLEDMAAELGFDFDWTSELAMSKSRGMFRTAASLTEQFIAQLELKS
jgi:acyl carrier protein